MNLARILNRMSSIPWAITEDAMKDILAIAERDNMDPQAVAQKLGRKLENSYDVQVRDGVAVLPVNGPLFRYANLFTEISGATSYQMLARDFAQALEDPNVTGIVLEIDSPGGDANGVAEFADQVFAARGQKPVVAYVGGMAASAAYWIASAADQIVMSDTAFAGSIGTVMELVKMQDREGVKRYQIVSSQSPYKRVDIATEEGQARYQRIVDDLSSVFINKVARNRGTDVDTVLADFGKGDIMIAERAIAAGMADSLGSLEGVIASLGEGATSDQFEDYLPGAGQSSASSRGGSHMLKEKNPAANNGPEITLDLIKSQHGEIAQALIDEGVQSVDVEGKCKAAADSERERVLGILNSEHAEGRESLAKTLAGRVGMSVEDAEAILQASPKAETPKGSPDFLKAMDEEGNPKVGADSDTDKNDEDTYVERSAALGKQYGIE